MRRVRIWDGESRLCRYEGVRRGRLSCLATSPSLGLNRGKVNVGQC